MARQRKEKTNFDHSVRYFSDTGHTKKHQSKNIRLLINNILYSIGLSIPQKNLTGEPPTHFIM
jgi:hypothetical protein